MKNAVSAIIVAAGNSSRMNISQSKQFVKLDGHDLISYTLTAFQKSEYVSEIIVVARECDFAKISKIAKQYNITKFKNPVLGGDTRQQSVLNGVKSVDNSSEFIAIHDGARPLITTQIIDNAIVSAFSCLACTVAVEVVDTLKSSDDNLKIVKTVDRAGLWSIQTPQVFSKNLYIQAVEKAMGENKDFTDDCQLIENMGGDVYIVRGEKSNIKVTYKEDVVFASALIKTRRECI